MYLCLFLFYFSIFISTLSFYIEQKIISWFIIITNKILWEKPGPERLNGQDNKSLCINDKKTNKNYKLHVSSNRLNLIYWIQIGFEALGNKTKGITSRLRNEWIEYFVFMFQSLKANLEFYISELANFNTRSMCLKTWIEISKLGQ